MKKIKSLVYTALFSALIAVCALISVPSTPPFTLQTFAIFLAIFTLGSKRAFTAILVYTLTGLAGAPIFFGFNAGVSVLFGATGGYLLGFLLMPTTYSLVRVKGAFTRALACALSLTVCYFFGILWFMHVYSMPLSLNGIVAAAQVCVLPFILPDALKAFLACLIHKRIKITEK